MTGAEGGGPAVLAAILGAGVPEVPWLPVLGLALLGALLSLDDTALGQTWLSQPLPAGLLAGIVCGDPATGAAIGLPFQLVTLGNLPVGQTFTGEKVSATVAGVGGAVLAGQALTLPATARGDGALGWALLAVCLWSLAGHRLVQLERGTHFVWMLEGHRTLWDGRLQRFTRLQWRCLAATAGRGFALTLIWLLVAVGLWHPLYPELPGSVERACALLPLLAAPLGLAAVADLYGWRAGWRWLGGGLVAGGLIGWWT